ncbi:redoxin domain-containing protein [Spongiactinospora sp. TRM90649]|uniref:TlpA family protein disulfide reductase n=1 Tax=Spongiactinospora sp. TRM90649 TaxID=3031114 RepID=UPI0023F838BD|nr:redoxin domain-containing protein [Spongiactinospora sp. TRM90649]MDF5757994.1 redoxin domain-containing protein [Spongiactinospora sp. TRM90649]
MTALRVTIAGAASALLLAACGTEATQTAQTAVTATSPPPATSATPRVPSAAPSVPAALKFSAKTLDGKAFQGESLAGKPVVFWFWAPWCPKCRAEAPHVKSAAATYRDVAFVGVASLDSEAAMKEFVQRTGTGAITHLSDEKGEVWADLGIASQSTFLFLKPDGTTTKASGPLDAQELNAHVEKLRAG